MRDLKSMIGKKVWFRRPGCDVNEGVIESVLDGSARIILKGAEGWPDNMCVVMYGDIYEDKLDLLGANYKEYRRKIDGYVASIKDVEGLVRFCYGHNMEDDFEAQTAAREVFAVLFGKELDEKAAKEQEEILELLKDGSEG